MSAVLDTAFRRGEIYSTAEAKRRLGCTEWGWREFKKRLGNRIFSSGVAKFVRSDDLMDVLDDIAREQQGEGE